MLKYVTLTWEMCPFRRNCRLGQHVGVHIVSMRAEIRHLQNHHEEDSLPHVLTRSDRRPQTSCLKPDHRQSEGHSKTITQTKMRITIIVKLLSILLPFTFARSWNTNDECPSKIKTTVSSDPCKYSTEGYRCSTEPEFDTMEAVHNALKHCPNISSLDLRVTSLGCSEWPERYDFPFTRSVGDKYANLTSLRLEGYNFGKPRFVGGVRNKNLVSTWLEKLSKFSEALRPQRVMQVLKPANDKTHLDLWLDAMDWSYVEEFAIDNRDITDEVLAKLPLHLTSLRKLETTNTSFITALPNNTLTHIKSVGPSNTTDLSAILTHQNSLSSLEFRRPEHAYAPFTTGFDISILPTLAHNLTHIAINIPRNGTWPLETLATIASLPKLESADLYMNIASECTRQRSSSDLFDGRKWYKECLGEEQFQQPFVSREAAEEVFGYMKSVKDGVALRNVTFWVGDWTRGWDGALYLPEWLEGKRARVDCGVEGGEEEALGECKVVTGEEYWVDKSYWQ
jgi:hypothetical protein